MNFHSNNIIIGVFILMAFLSMAVFGLLQFSHVMHSEETPMVNCPYAENGFSVCQNILEHVNSWRQFSNALISSFVSLLLAFGAFLYFVPNILTLGPDFRRWRYYFHNKKLSKYWSDIVNWLSLFENSPSFSYARRR